MRTWSFCLVAAACGAVSGACSSNTDDGKGFDVGKAGATTTSATGSTGATTSGSTTGSGGSSSSGAGTTSGATTGASGGAGDTGTTSVTSTTSGTAGAGGAGGTSGTGGSAGMATDGGGGSGQPGGDGGSTDPSKNVELVWKSSGCGMPLPSTQVPTVPGSRTGYTEFHVQQTGKTLAATDPSKAVSRQFFVRVPVDYDMNKAYRVVYITQGCGNLNDGKNATYPLFNEAQGGTEQAVYVAISLPPNTPNNNCYDNRAGFSSQEWEALDLFHNFVESKYCVDNNRIYTAGYSSGGWVANMWGCYFAGIPSPPRTFLPKWALRGRASVTGGIVDGNPPCNGPIAGMWIHDAGDTENVIAGSITALNSALKMNKCEGSPTVAWTGLPAGVGCKQYTACPKDYPIIFCTTNGLGHQDQANSAIPGFKKFFDLMNP